MDIPVLLEPTPTGWRASTGAPLNLVAEGPDKDALLATFRDQILHLYVEGTRIAKFTVPACDPLLDLVKEMAANPFMEEWMKGIAEYRAEVNIPPELAETEEGSATQPLNGATHGTHEVTPTSGS